jgi:IS30 family transposase
MCAHTCVRGDLAQISRAVAEGQSIRAIAARLGRAPSTVSREIGRDGRRADYRATEADLAAWDRALSSRALQTGRGQSFGASISERPASAEDRAVPGHWEGDLMFDARNSQIATLLERQTRYVMLAKVAGKDTETVVDALIKNTRKLPQEL